MADIIFRSGNFRILGSNQSCYFYVRGLDHWLETRPDLNFRDSKHNYTGWLADQVPRGIWFNTHEYYEQQHIFKVCQTTEIRDRQQFTCNSRLGFIRGDFRILLSGNKTLKTWWEEKPQNVNPYEYLDLCKNCIKRASPPDSIVKFL